MDAKVAVRVLAFGNNPDKYFIHKLLDNGEWVEVVLEGREIYQIERELKCHRRLEVK